MPEDMLEKDVKKYIRKGWQTICQTRISEDVPQRISEEISEHISDKNVKRYIRGSVNRKNMLDKNVKTYIKKNTRENARNYGRKGC